MKLDYNRDSQGGQIPFFDAESFEEDNVSVAACDIL